MRVVEPGEGAVEAGGGVNDAPVGQILVVTVRPGLPGGGHGGQRVGAGIGQDAEVTHRRQSHGVIERRYSEVG